MALFGCFLLQCWMMIRILKDKGGPIEKIGDLVKNEEGPESKILLYYDVTLQ